jgi:hypothetical protein
MTLRPGWHSTIFGPYFVIGAIFSGTAAIITAMAVFRRAYRLERYLLPEHFQRLATLLLALSLLYSYFTLSEYLTAWYGGFGSDSRLLALLAGSTAYGASFWLWGVFGLFIPIGLLVMPSRRSLTAIVTASVLINIGMWIKRYLIIVPTLETPFIPAQAAGITPHYFPSLVECTITVGAFAAFLLLFTLFSRIFPILSVWETLEDAEEAESKVAVERASRHTSLAPAALTILLIAGALTSVVPWARASAQVQKPVPRIELTRSMVDSQDVLVAKVSTNGRAVVHAVVEFSVTRTFGVMTLGQDTTRDDGTARVGFPVGLPGDARGELKFRVSIESPSDLIGPPLEVVLAGGAPRVPLIDNVPRALWSSRAPLPMVATIIFLLLCVWITYAFVVIQLLAMSRLKEQA